MFEAEIAAREQEKITAVVCGVFDVDEGDFVQAPLLIGLFGFSMGGGVLRWRGEHGPIYHPVPFSSVCLVSGLMSATAYVLSQSGECSLGLAHRYCLSRDYSPPVGRCFLFRRLQLEISSLT